MAQRRTSQLRATDVRAIYTLLGECRELGADNATWRRHLLLGLRRSLDGFIGISMHAGWRRADGRTLPFDGPQMIKVAPSGIGNHLERFIEKKEETRDPSWIEVARRDEPILTCTRRQLVDDQRFYSSTTFNEFRRPGRCDDFIRSIVELAPDGECHVITILRELGDEPFSERNRRFLHLTHLELSRWLGRGLALGGEPGTEGLTPRLRETLDLLLDGLSEKELARELGISPATVHEYVTKLFRHFRVNSRAELMSRCLRRPGAHDPWRIDRA